MMKSDKKKISLLDGGKITLPQEMIPKDVTRFECERGGDGRIVLTPIRPHANLYMESCGPAGEGREVKEDPTPVIDFQTSRAFRRKHSAQKSEKNTPVSRNDWFEKNGKFVKLHLFSSRLEAEMLGEILRQSEIPYLIQSEDIGLFGPGASPAPGGARLVVRECYLEDARDLLLGLIELP